MLIKNALFLLFSYLSGLNLLSALLYSGICKNFLSIFTQRFSMFVSILFFTISSLLLMFFDKLEPYAQFVINILCFMPLLNIDMCIGVDGVSIYFILLTTFLIPICILINWNNKVYNSKLFLYNLFLLEFFLILAFSVFDFFFFYVFFECVLIPMFIIIGKFGSLKRKIKASFYFFFFTLIGSMFLLIALTNLYVSYGTTSFYSLFLNQLVIGNHWFTNSILVGLLFIGFAVKVPMFPFHIWLPEAHVEAPTVGSVVLAGLLLKLGGYGILRFIVFMFNEIVQGYLYIITSICLVGVILSSIMVFRQLDIKRAIAYSSVAHMSFSIFGVISNNLYGQNGAIMLMVSHGFVSSALFICAGILYNRFHTRNIHYFGGIAHLMPVFSIFFFLFSLANCGFPLTGNFIGELLIFVSILDINVNIFILIGCGLFLSSCYSFWLFSRICFGQLNAALCAASKDLTLFEVLTLLMLLVVTLVCGIFSNIVFDYTSGTLLNTLMVSILNQFYFKLN